MKYYILVYGHIDKNISRHEFIILRFLTFHTHFFPYILLENA